MEISIVNIITASCGAIISGALVSVARGMSLLNVQVATLNTQVASMRGDLDRINNSYVTDANFKERLERFENDLNGIGQKLSKVHDEHLSCLHCKKQVI